MPTEAEIQRAKDYLLLRLEAERIAVSSIDTALLEAAKRIIAISRKYNIPPESFRFSANPSLQADVRGVLSLLRDALFDRIEKLDTFTEDKDNTFIAPALTEKDKGKTFRQRLAEYVSHWGYELEATIAGAGLSGITNPNAILAGVQDYLDYPYDNPWIQEHQKEGDAVRLWGIPHFGRGRAISSRLALTTLVSTVVAKGWMQNWGRLNEGKRDTMSIAAPPTLARYATPKWDFCTTSTMKWENLYFILTANASLSM